MANNQIALLAQMPQFDTPIESQGKALQIRQLMNQGAVQDMDLEKRRQEASDEQAGRNAFSSNPTDSAARLAAFANISPTAYRAEAKSQAALAQSGAELGETKSKTAKLDHETASHQFELAGQLASAWAQNPNVTQKGIRSGLASAAHSKIISPEIYQAKITELDGLPDDSPSLNKWAMGTLQQVMKSKDSMGQIAPDANAVLTNKTSRDNNASTNATQQRGQNMTDLRARELNAITREGQQTQVVNDPNQGVLLVNKGTKTAVPARFADGTQVPSENAVAAGKLNSQLQAGITMARELIPKATGSGAGAMVDKGAAFFGKSTDGADAASQLETLAGWMTANVPRMQGPQSDKDVLLYRQMAADVGNSAVPAERRLAALSTLEQLQTKYAAINKASGVPAPANKGAGAPSANAKGWALHTDAKGNKAYVSPDGKSFEEVK